jgi:polyketide synthase PksN
MEENAIDLEKSFVEMGLDSVVGVEWIRSINEQYTCHLNATSVYDYPTIRQLANFLQKELLLHRGEKDQVSTQPVSTSLLDDILQQVQQRNLDPEEAEQLVQKHFL